MKLSFILFLLPCFLIHGCNLKTDIKQASQSNETDDSTSQIQIAAMLDSFNATAARGDFNGYFSHFADDANTIFMGTDATEHWTKKEFMEWTNPHFRTGRGWDFKTLKRNIYMRKESADLAWFDELLDTWMKICRGSGVVIRENGQWKVVQYVLSMTVPNSLGDSAVRLKGNSEDSLINALK